VNQNSPGQRYCEPDSSVYELTLAASRCMLDYIYRALMQIAEAQHWPQPCRRRDSASPTDCSRGCQVGNSYSSWLAGRCMAYTLFDLRLKLAKTIMHYPADRDAP
jgi:hypothetical protein